MAKIVHLANMYSPVSGGLKTSINALGETYTAMGHDFMLIVPGKKYSKSRTAYGLKYEIPSFAIPCSGGYRIILKTSLVKEILSQFKPDVVEISDRTTLLFLGRWAKRYKILTILFAHERVDGVINAFLGSWLPSLQLANFWNKISAKWFDHIVATTNYSSAEYSRIGLNVDLVPLGVDLNRFNPEFKDLELKRKLVGEHKFAISVTRLSKEKDPMFLIDIARSVKKEDSDFLIKVAGQGPLLNKLIEITNKEDLPIEFLGHIGDRSYLSQLLATADVYLAPGPIETFGLAALESLASGTPVVCRQSGAIKEIISTECGISAPRFADSWLKAMECLTRRDRFEIARESRARAEGFTWHMTASKLIEIYRLNEPIRRAA
jgi:alpha-1,6-mannosyltransferase